VGKAYSRRVSGKHLVGSALVTEHSPTTFLAFAREYCQDRLEFVPDGPQFRRIQFRLKEMALPGHGFRVGRQMLTRPRDGKTFPIE